MEDETLLGDAFPSLRCIVLSGAARHIKIQHRPSQVNLNPHAPVGNRKRVPAKQLSNRNSVTATR
jgi:hypothetical protein